MATECVLPHPWNYGSRDGQGWGWQVVSDVAARTVWPIGRVLCYGGCWYFVSSRINPQTHGYRCSFHPRVFQDIVSTRDVSTLSTSSDSPRTYTSVGG